MSTTDDNDDQHGDSSDEMTSNKKDCTSCEQNINVDNITEGIGSAALLDDTSTCANCGKEGNSNNMNICNKCKMVKYCNAACKKKHRSKHKKACERRVAELYDEKLYTEPPPSEECPICMQPLPLDRNQVVFESCCGKTICNGCIYAMKISGGKDLCAFCRKPKATSNEEEIKRVKNLMDNGNAYSFNFLGYAYNNGLRGMSQDYHKANELYLKAGELGCADAYFNLGNSYARGRGVEVDIKKARHYHELAAIAGNVQARHNLGSFEYEAGNIQRAKKHMIIAARAGEKDSLDCIKNGFRRGFITKDEYLNTLRAYHERQNEMKSDQREIAAQVHRVAIVKRD